MILSFGSPSLVLTSCTALALFAYVMAVVVPSGRLPTAALVLAWVAHLLAIGADTLGWGLPDAGARFGFAPALSVTLWMVLGVYAIESRFVPLPGPRRVLAGLGAVAVTLAWLFPGELHGQLGARWAPLHWILGIASYGLFGVAVLHGAMLNAAERRMRAPPQSGAFPVPTGLPLLRLEKMTFRFVAAGFVVLTLAIAQGMLVLQPWRWDHKAVFSVLGWMVFAALLLGRQTLGWRGRKATLWLYLGAALLLLAYVGSRFVLEVLLQRSAVVH